MIKELYKIVEDVAPKLPYHNYEHMKDVANAAFNYAVLEGLDHDDALNLATAGILHDVIYIPGRDDNEEKAAELAGEILESLGYSEQGIIEVKRLILATKFPTAPQDHLEQIICDADLDNLGREDFFDHSERLRQEMGIEESTWYQEIQPSFLRSIQYYTDSARELRQPGIEKNLEKLGGLKK